MSETFYLYEFNFDGCHQGYIKVKEEDLDKAFTNIVLKARNEKRTVIITDVMDMCVFHMKNGEVIYPKPGTRADS